MPRNPCRVAPTQEPAVRARSHLRRGTWLTWTKSRLATPRPVTCGETEGGRGSEWMGASDAPVDVSRAHHVSSLQTTLPCRGRWVHCGCCSRDWTGMT